MHGLRRLLAVSTVTIFALTAVIAVRAGINWPAVFFGDLIAVDWRSQFNADFLIHLLLLAGWIWWREGGGGRGYAFGFLSVFLGGMFTFPYLMLAIGRAGGDPRGVLLGTHAGRNQQAVAQQAAGEA